MKMISITLLFITATTISAMEPEKKPVQPRQPSSVSPRRQKIEPLEPAAQSKEQVEKSQSFKARLKKRLCCL